MVIRKEKRKLKYYGTRRWGVGNIKNARGKGGRGGTGKAGMRKHKFTWLTAKHPELIKRRGFKPWNQNKLTGITLREINSMALRQPELKEMQLKGHKVISNGQLERALTIKASGFSKQAMEKIKKSGGEAVKV
ncbi:MAG: uL15 family ribosomal protein [Candidatus Micrarchaeota archaeon]|nr:uL15 family ribosomal protein [Candidatus Micrarchaeota archaeon]